MLCATLVCAGSVLQQHNLEACVSMGCDGVGSEEEEGTTDTSKEPHSHGSSWPKPTMVLGEELRLGEQGSEHDGSENVLCCLELSRKINVRADRAVAKKNKRKNKSVAGPLYALVHPSVPTLGLFGWKTVQEQKSGGKSGSKPYEVVCADTNGCVLQPCPAIGVRLPSPLHPP